MAAITSVPFFFSFFLFFSSRMTTTTAATATNATNDKSARIMNQRPDVFFFSLSFLFIFLPFYVLFGNFDDQDERCFAISLSLRRHCYDQTVLHTSPLIPFSRIKSAWPGGVCFIFDLKGENTRRLKRLF